jgi:hypothetical protein
MWKLLLIYSNYTDRFMRMSVKARKQLDDKSSNTDPEAPDMPNFERFYC